MKFSAVVVSRMDHEIGLIVNSIARLADEIIIVRGDQGVWERWEAAAKAKHDVIYTQDDDAVVAVSDVIAAYDSDRVVCNMPADHRKDYPDGVALVGWGCVFHISKLAVRTPWEVAATEFVGAFGAYRSWCAEDEGTLHLASDSIFKRECDRVFTGLSDLTLIDVERVHLPQAHYVSRMGREPKHGACLQEIRRRIYEVRKWREVLSAGAACSQ